MRLATLLGIGTLGVSVVYVPWALLYRLTGGELGIPSVVVLTISMPALAWTVCHYAGRLASAHGVARLVPFVIVVGIWIAGPIIMITRAALSEQPGSNSIANVSIFFLNLPFVALISAGYHGTFFGLLLASVVIWFPNASWGDV